MFNEKLVIAKWNADMYDQQITEQHDVDFLISTIGPAPLKVLEVCCGSGRILVPLAKAGHVVYGIDADEFMLAKISAKADGIGNIQWSKADAVRDDWGAGYGAVVLAGNILFNIVSDTGNEQAQKVFIQKAADALVPGGYLYIDYSPGGHRLTQPEPSHEVSNGFVVWEGTDSDGNFGRMTLLAGTYDADTGLDRFVRRFELTLADGEIINQDILCEKHFATLDQLHVWLRDAGLTVTREYGDYQGSSVNGESTRVIILAQKEAL